MIQWVSDLTIEWVSEWTGAPQLTLVEDPSQPQVSPWTWGRWVGRDLFLQRGQSRRPSSRSRSSVALFLWGLAGGKWVEWVNPVLQPPGPTELRAAVRVVPKAMALKMYRNNSVVVKGHWASRVTFPGADSSAHAPPAWKSQGSQGTTSASVPLSCLMVERLSFQPVYL